MKTTVEVADSLFAEAKAYAKARGVSFREVLEEGLRFTLQQSQRNQQFLLRDGSFRGEGLQSDLSWAEIRQRIYEGRGE